MAERDARGGVGAEIRHKGGGVCAVFEEEDGQRGGGSGDGDGCCVGGGGEACLHPVEEGVGCWGGVGGDIDVDHEDCVGGAV